MIPYTLNYIFNTPTAKGSLLRIRLGWYCGGKKIIASVSTHFSVNPQKWSHDVNRLKLNTTHGAKRVPAATINKGLNEIEQRIDRAFAIYSERGESPTAEELKRLLLRLEGKLIEEIEPFFDAFSRYIFETSKEKDWDLKMIGRAKHIRDCIHEVDPKLTFKRFDSDFMARLLIYFRDTRKLRNVTTTKLFSRVRSFARWAQRNKLLCDESVLTYSPSLKNPPKAIIYLNWAELMQVYGFEFREDQRALERVRDLFCFCCFTSLRFSDAVNLRRSNIYPDYIEITTIKTADHLRIDLNKYSRAILEKYASEEYPQGRALPSISNQRTNDYLKSIGLLCGLDTPMTITTYNGNTRSDCTYRKYELLTTHCGRRTFICNALALGITPTIVMKWTGHSDYKAMKPYIDIADETKAAAMNLFN